MLEGRADDSAADALKWMQLLSSGEEQMIFRGQTCIYPNILPSLMRANISEEDRLAWWAVMRQFISSRDGLTGYRIRSPHDAVAVVQHYLVKSPVIDVTASPEVAIYFALLNSSSTQKRVVYAIKVRDVKAAGYVVTDHDFLVLPFEDGIKHRWLRQDGLTVGAPDLTDLDKARELDFAQLPGLQSFSLKTQLGAEELVAGLGDLEAVEGDSLATKVRGMFESIAQHLKLVEQIRPLMPLVGNIDSHGALLAEINAIIKQAHILDFSSNEVQEIETMREAASGGYWDSAWECSLSYWHSRIGNVENR